MARRKNITDRALRYRANQAIPEHAHVCVFCGAKSKVEVAHLDGREENTSPDNLSWTCRPCNVIAGNVLRSNGLGRLTRQYNPTKSGGAANVGEWLQAVGAITPHNYSYRNQGLAGSSMSVPDAVAMIRATPHSKRSEFASKLRRGRRNPAWLDSLLDSPLKHGTVPAVGGAAKFTPRSKSKLGKVSTTRYKGYSIGRTSTGEYYSSLDPDSWYDSLPDVKRSIDRWQKGRMNPAKFDRCVRDVKRKRGGANAYAVCTAAGTRNNPSTAAAEVFEEFQGRPSREVVTVAKKIHRHDHLAAAGELRKLKVKGVDGQTHSISGFKGSLLCFNEQKNQLFIEGGDQSINLEDYGIRKPHELETLGKVLAVEYFTTKDHLGEDGGTATYAHRFRTTNENGKHVTVDVARYPDLIYRVREAQMEFSGGSYFIRREGIDL